MDRKYKVGGYVKLAKLWERSKDAAVAYHSSYYAEKFRDDADKRLIGVYIDITGNKEIYKRPEMVHLLKNCKNGVVNLVFSQTRAYLAANTCDFCFLLKYLFDLPMRVDIVTDDDDQRIDTIQVLLEANGLAAGKDHQFKGRYDAEKNAVIISLEKDEQSALSPQKCTT